MIKLGTDCAIQIGKARAWGYDIKRIWLCKDLTINQYVVMGLCWDGEKAHGWCHLKVGTLAECRRYAQDLI